MAFAQLEGSTYSREAVDTTSHDVDLTGIAPGYRAVLFASIDGDGTNNIISGLPAGWEIIWQDDSSSDNGTAFVAEKLDATGSEVSFAYTTSTSQTSKNTVLFWSGSSSSVAMEAGVHVTGSSSNEPNPPSLSPSWGSDDNVFVAFYSSTNGRGSTVAFPANYENTFTDAVNDDSDINESNFGIATREVAGATEDPGAFDRVSSDPWVANTFVIPPASDPVTGEINQAVEVDSARLLVSLQGGEFPEVVPGFEAVQAGLTQVDLTWRLLTDPEGREVVYDIERRPTDGGGTPTGDWDLIVSGLTETFFSDSGLGMGGSYEYRLRGAIGPVLRAGLVEEIDQAFTVVAAADVTLTVNQASESNLAQTLSFILVGGEVSGFGYNISGAALQIPSGAVTATPSTLTSLINANPQGTVFALQTGTYNGTFPNKPGNQYYGPPSNPDGVVFNGNITFPNFDNGTAPNGGSLIMMTGENNNIWANMVIQRYRTYNTNAGGPIQLSGASNYLFRNVLFQDNWRAGLAFGGSNGEATFVTSRYNGAYGYTGGGTGHLIRNCDSYHCGDTTVENRNIVAREDGGDRGGSKFAFTSNFMVRDSRWWNFDSNVQGVWFDINNRNTTIQDCHFEDIPRQAIHIELSHGPNIIRRNTIIGCGYVNRQWIYDSSAILCPTSGPSEIYQNDINGEGISKNGITLMQNNRDTAGDESAQLERWERWTELHGSAIYENTVRNIVQSWLGGTCLYTRPAQYATIHDGCNFVQDHPGDVTFENNTTPGADRFMWGNSATDTGDDYRTPSQWAALGHS